MLETFDIINKKKVNEQAEDFGIKNTPSANSQQQQKITERAQKFDIYLIDYWITIKEINRYG